MAQDTLKLLFVSREEPIVKQALLGWMLGSKLENAN
jgi:hypothetical protein